MDIREFTQRVFAQNCESLLTAKNDFLGAMVEIVFRHAGVVDKLMGDGLIAELGIFNEEPCAPAHRAVMAAKDMILAAEGFNVDKKPQKPFRINIGIASGELHVGHIGGKGFLDLSVLGRPENLAGALILFSVI